MLVPKNFVRQERNGVRETRRDRIVNTAMNQQSNSPSTRCNPNISGRVVQTPAIEYGLIAVDWLPVGHPAAHRIKVRVIKASANAQSGAVGWMRARQKRQDDSSVDRIGVTSAWCDLF